jgi:hypothetical protein
MGMYELLSVCACSQYSVIHHIRYTLNMIQYKRVRRIFDDHDCRAPRFILLSLPFAIALTFYTIKTMSINHEQDGDISLASSHSSRPPNTASTSHPATPAQNPPSTWREAPKVGQHQAPFVAEPIARRMQRWVHDVVVCNFDLETGPVIDRSILRPSRSKREKENL